jgi:hypothetical protein
MGWAIVDNTGSTEDATRDTNLRVIIWKYIEQAFQNLESLSGLPILSCI